MTSLTRFYLANARNGLVSEFQYRAAAAVGLLGFLIEPIIYLVVWRTVAEAQGGAVGGYDANDFTAYYIVWSLVRVMNLALTPYSWEWRIRGGRLNDLLSKPVHPFHFDFSFFAGQKPVWIGVWIPVAIVLWVTFRPQVDVSLGTSLVFLVTIWAAFAIRHMFLFLLGAVNFWTTRTSALFELNVAIEVMLSGRLVPLSLMPDWVERIADFLPYRWTFQFPIETMIGRLDWGAIGAGLVAQAAWIVGLALVIRLVWGRAIRRYTAVGG
jgi:ABC-2 type transport system permease protein